MYGHGHRFRVRRQPFAGPDRVSRTGPAEAKRKAATRKAGRHGFPAGKSEYAAEPETPLLFRFLRDVRTVVRPETVLAPGPCSSGDIERKRRRHGIVASRTRLSGERTVRGFRRRPRYISPASAATTCRQADGCVRRTPSPTGCPHPSPRTIRPTAEKYPYIYG